jgi:hypothetical protein
MERPNISKNKMLLDTLNQILDKEEEEEEMIAE